jgi:hypothetical protein
MWLAFLFSIFLGSTIRRSNKDIKPLSHPVSAGAYDWLAASYEKEARPIKPMPLLEVKGTRGAPQRVSSIPKCVPEVRYSRLLAEGTRGAERSKSVDACWMNGLRSPGREEQALEFLNRSFQQHCSGPHTVIADPIDVPPHDPKFKTLSPGSDCRKASAIRNGGRDVLLRCPFPLAYLVAHMS